MLAELLTTWGHRAREGRQVPWYPVASLYWLDPPVDGKPYVVEFVDRKRPLVYFTAREAREYQARLRPYRKDYRDRTYLRGHFGGSSERVYAALSEYDRYLVPRSDMSYHGPLHELHEEPYWQYEIENPE